MNLSFILLLALFGAASSQKLNPAENNYLQSICGTQPNLGRKRFIDGSIGVPSNHSAKPYIKNIFGGIPVSAYDAPWSVKVLIAPTTYCSGTIISSRHILTARHCIEDLPAVVAGSLYSCDNFNQMRTGVFYDLNIELADGSRLPQKITTIYEAGGCNSHWSQADLMILQLERDISFSVSAYPVCVPKDTSRSQRGSPVELYSYGANSRGDTNSGGGVLRYGHMTINAIYDYGRQYEMYSTKFAARKGDSGGGYLQKWDGRRYVIGVMSTSDETMSPYGPSYGPLVGYYYPMICQYTGIC